MYKSFEKPPSSLKWLKFIPEDALDRPLTSKQLCTIAKHASNWREKAIGLGLEECDIEDIQEDNRGKNRLKKTAMMRRWREINGDRATLRELIMLSQRYHWNKFIAKACMELGYGTQGKMI